MERRTRIWVGLGAAVLVSGTVDRTALAQGAPQPVPGARGISSFALATPERLYLAQDAFSAGEGGPGEGGGQVLGTITEFRLGSTDATAFAYDAAVQVGAYAALVAEAYAAAEAGAEALKAAVDALVAEPSASTLAVAQSAWLEARTPFLRTEAFQFYGGPVDGVGGPIARLNSWPVDPEVIDAIIADPGTALNFRALARMNQADGPTAVTTGFHAMEYLLWSEDGSRSEADFAGEANARRRDYLAAVALLLVNDLRTLTAAWAPGQNNYRAALEKMDQRNALGRTFNGMTVLVGYELPLRRIGAGLFPANENFQQSPFSDSSAEDNRLAFEGARAVYEQTGLDALVAAVDPELAARIAGDFDQASAALAALDAPYGRFLAPSPASPERAAAETAIAALTTLGRDLRQAGNRLGVLVVVPGL